MDYIFDWARDLYRTGIQRTLQSLSQQDFDDTASLLADSDIYSSRKIFQANDMMSEMDSTYGGDILPSPSQNNSLLAPWAKFDLRIPLRPQLGPFRISFRPKNVIKSKF